MARDPLNRRDRLRLVDPPRLVLHDPADDLPGDPNYNGVGAALRAERRQQGYSLDEVATRIRIRRDYLRAVEDGRFGDLPGASYAQGYVRSYSDFLGLDAAQVLAAYRQEETPVVAERRLNFPVPAADQRSPRLWILMLAVVLCLAVYLGWAVYQERQYVASRDVPPVPDSIQAAAPPAAPEVPAAAQAPVLAPPARAPVALVPPVVLARPLETPPAPGDSPASASPIPLPAAPAVTAPPAAAVTPPPPPPLPTATPAAPPPVRTPGVFGSEAQDVRVVIKATQRAWVRVATGQGQTLFQRILEPGEVYRVPEQPDLVLDAGNLGGIEIAVQGKALAPLGAPGVPRRNISLAPASLLERSSAAN